MSEKSNQIKEAIDKSKSSKDLLENLSTIIASCEKYNHVEYAEVSCEIRDELLNSFFNPPKWNDEIYLELIFESAPKTERQLMENLLGTQNQIINQLIKEEINKIKTKNTIKIDVLKKLTSITFFKIVGDVKKVEEKDQEVINSICSGLSGAFKENLKKAQKVCELNMSKMKR